MTYDTSDHGPFPLPGHAFWNRLPPAGSLAGALDGLSHWLRESDAAGQGAVLPLISAGACYLLCLKASTPTSALPASSLCLEAGMTRWAITRLAAQREHTFHPTAEMATGLARQIGRWLRPEFGLSPSAWQTAVDFGVWMARTAHRVGHATAAHAARDGLLACLLEPDMPSRQRFLMERMTGYWQFLASSGLGSGEVLYGLDYLRRQAVSISPLAGPAGTYYVRLWGTVVRGMPFQERSLLSESLREVLETAPPTVYHRLPPEAAEIAIAVLPRRLAHCAADGLLPSLLRLGSPLASTTFDSWEQTLTGLTDWVRQRPSGSGLFQQWQQGLEALTHHETWAPIARHCLTRLSQSTSPAHHHVAPHHSRSHLLP